MKHLFKTLGIGLGVLMALGSMAGAETFLVRSVTGCGGAVVSGSDRQLKCTAGQCAVGVVQGTGYVHRIGFWPEAGSLPSDVAPWLSDIIPSRASLLLGGSNPFSSSTSVVYGVPARAPVRISLYDLAGRQVRILQEGVVEPGYHRVLLTAGGLTGGVYFCRMTTSGFAQTRRVIVLR